jgi:hypothetical protein
MGGGIEVDSEISYGSYRGAVGRDGKQVSKEDASGMR